MLRRLASPRPSHLLHRRYTSSVSKKTPQPQPSIFSSAQSPWDHLFDKIDDTPPLLPPRKHTTITHSQKPGKPTPPGSSSPPSTSLRRQTMTTREIAMFDEIFNMIFTAVADQHPSSSSSSSDPPTSVRRIPQFSGMGDLFAKLRRRSRQLNWTSELDELLDRQKEAIDLCATDHELLEWASRELFPANEELPSTAAADPDHDHDHHPHQSNEPLSSSPVLQPETYPHLLAHLMRTFRDKFHDPHLALAMFDHARNLSIPSYVFGCSTPTYNELIETRWSCFRDLKGVHDALEEMIVNGVDPDRRTRKIVELIRRHVGEHDLWEDEHGLTADGDIFRTLAKIEALVSEDSPSRVGHKYRRPQTKPWNAWKRSAGDVTNDDDGWRFDEWDRDHSRSSKTQSDLEFS